MNASVRFLLAVLFLSVYATSVRASEPEVLWLKLEKVFTYKDIDRFCSTKDLPTTIYFGAEVADGSVQAAILKTDTFEPLSEKLPFTAAELAEIKISSASSGGNWIESIKLNARQLEWLFTHAGGMDECVPTQKLATLGPNDFKYAFDLSQILASPPQVSSNLGRFSGKRKDGRLYQASLYLVQKRIK